MLCYNYVAWKMPRQKSVRIDGELIEPLKRLVTEKRDALGLRRYRSLSQAAEDAVRQFLLKETHLKHHPREAQAR